MLDNISNYNIILASKSPRRHFLLKELEIDFSIMADSNIDESYPEKLKNEEIVLFLAKHKANYYTKKLQKNDLLITADTIVLLNGVVVQKPEDRDDAIKILKSLSGNKHTVFTGVCIRTLQKSLTFFAKTDVYFNKLKNEEIYYYIDKYQPYDKAGAYGIQEWIGYIGIEKIDGSYFNVMGLPVQKLYEELSNF